MSTAEQVHAAYALRAPHGVRAIDRRPSREMTKQGEDPGKATVTMKRDPFAQDSAGRTALFYAAERGDLEEVRRIIFSLAGTGLWPQRLALIELRDSAGLTASDVAEEAGYKKVADLLRGEQMRMEFFE